MTFKGTVKQGVVVLEQGSSIPEGTEVRVEVVRDESGSLGDRLLKFAGTAPGLPEDMADNHDHYVHGAPKK
jgi:hypothetical protein